LAEDCVATTFGSSFIDLRDFAIVRTNPRPENPFVHLHPSGWSAVS
jgi:hypothetical protein